MEAAFWNGMLESMEDEPNYDRIIQLVGEVLKSKNLDIDNLGKILKFALGTLQKLSSPAQEDAMKLTHQKLLKELTETCQTTDDSKNAHAVAMIKGLSFVLEQVQHSSYWQILRMEWLVVSVAEMENVLWECSKHLLELLDRSDNIGIEEIVEILSGTRLSQNGEPVYVDNHQSWKLVMARMLAKSFQAADRVFEKVSDAVYVAARAVVLRGSGPQGRKLAEMALWQIRAAMPIDGVVEAAEVLIVAATVSVGVQGPWYVNLID